MRRHVRSKIFFLSMALCALTFVSVQAATNDLATRLKKLTGQPRAKVVWTKTATPKQSDFPPDKSRFSDEILVGFDTKLGVVETLQTTRSNYQNPLLTYDGTRIVYTHLSAASDTIITYILDWAMNASPRKLVGRGMTACLWYDPSIKKDFIIYAAGCGQSAADGSIRKRNIDDTLSDTLAFKGNGQSPVTEWVRISADGVAFGGCMGNWGQNGENLEVDSSSGGLIVRNNTGCWPSMPYDNSYRHVKTIADHSTWQVKTRGGQPVDAVTDGWYLPLFSQLRMASYIPNIFLVVGYAIEGDNGTGSIQVIKTDSTLTTLKDTLTFMDTSFLSHHADLWAGPDSVAAGLIQFNRPHNAGLSMKNNAADIEFYSISGRRIGAARPQGKNLNSLGLPKGLCIAKSRGQSDVLRFVTINK